MRERPHNPWAALRPVSEAQDHGHAAERAAATLRQAIAEGQILPGQKLPEVLICEGIDVSRHTLRSAFQILAAEGLVDRVPNRGVFVHQPTVEDIRELYRVRRIIETGAVRAVELTDETLDELRSIVTRARAARDAGEVTAMAQANQEFHRTLISAAHSQLLSGLMEQILARMRLTFAGMHSEPHFHTDYVRRNGELTELLAAGRRDTAQDYLIDYLVTAENELLGDVAP
ncbi:GntR family transcriptional regulator [Nesterenkonia alba]|uniref:GntR family transcriptional regulator n=1 Tax=Nesterenkonia alba TaxID=515814 RepID=UPI0003B3282D|nr:GntR family transcriptional regulator [Nesterenkonia alba]